MESSFSSLRISCAILTLFPHLDCLILMVCLPDERFSASRELTRNFFLPGISVLWAQHINVNNPVRLYYTTTTEADEKVFIITWYEIKSPPNLLHSPKESLT